MSFKNEPQMMDSDNNSKVRRYVHQPLHIDHYGIHAQIHENGKITIKGKPLYDEETKGMEYDEVEVPASLIFDLAKALKMTRRIQYVDIHENDKS